MIELQSTEIRNIHEVLGQGEGRSAKGHLSKRSGVKLRHQIARRHLFHYRPINDSVLVLLGEGVSSSAQKTPQVQHVELQDSGCTGEYLLRD